MPFNLHPLKCKSYVFRTFVTIVSFIIVANILISIHMHIKLPFIIKEDGINLKSIIHKFSSSAQSIYQRKNHIFSIFNPILVYKYIYEDWKTFLDIPPLIKQCTFISTKLLQGLRFVNMISNSSFPFLPPVNEFPKHLLGFKNDSTVHLQNLLIVLLTSTRTSQRFDAARKTWIQHLTFNKSTNYKCTSTIHDECMEYFRCCLNISGNTSAKLIAVSDEIDVERGIITIPELKRKVSYHDAQHRQLMIMKHILRNCNDSFADKCLLKNIRWVALIDDDTWLNVNRTIEILSLLNSKQPIIVGHILTEQESSQDLLYTSGGAGTFLSESAFTIIASKLYDSCPFCKYNDLTIGTCASISNIERVHIPLFLAFRPKKLTPLIISNVATIHYMTPQDMLNSTLTLTNLT